MSAASSGDLVLVADVGNTRIKLACAGAGGPLPAVARRQDLLSRDFHPANLERWLAAAAPGPAVLLVAAVNEAAAARLEAAIAGISATGHRPLRQRRIGREHLTITLRVEAPRPRPRPPSPPSPPASSPRSRSRSPPPRSRSPPTCAPAPW